MAPPGVLKPLPGPQLSPWALDFPPMVPVSPRILPQSLPGPGDVPVPHYPGVTWKNKALAWPPGFSLISVLDLTWISWILPHFGAGFDPDLQDSPLFQGWIDPCAPRFPFSFCPTSSIHAPPEQLELNWELVGRSWDGQR